MKQVQIFINHKYLQMHSDGVVNGSLDRLNNNTVWKRIATNDSGVIIQSMAHCLYLCMNECGYVYSIDVPNHDCIFQEVFKENNYEFIVKKIEKKMAYLSLNIEGKPRRTVLRRREPIGEGLEYTRVMVTPWEETLLDETICPEMVRTKLSYYPKKSCKNPPKKRPITNDIPVMLSSDYEEEGLNSIVEDPTLIEGVDPKNLYLHENTDELSIQLLPNSTTASPPTLATPIPSKNNVTVVEEFISTMLRMPKPVETSSLLDDKKNSTVTEARQVFMKFENNFYINKCIHM
ncbi:FGF [Rachiplusia nu nucleopolyhedrovirus]|uniref:FGF n=1 Tax=Rachiplusia nu nucleopolyhedrovirus TaxID=2605775 RepID=A0AAF1DB40_9ABAC|nr:FGF [Rachiplusia nu nucleopolyhedrovirus]QEI03629.1 FGF [Rachiplusia nu nucleopolyhedrovirus]